MFVGVCSSSDLSPYIGTGNLLRFRLKPFRAFFAPRPRSGSADETTKFLDQAHPEDFRSLFRAR
mgnify:CR=1 FL=1|jgi:hypothetical protein